MKRPLHLPLLYSVMLSEHTSSVHLNFMEFRSEECTWVVDLFLFSLLQQALKLYLLRSSLTNLKRHSFHIRLFFP